MDADAIYRVVSHWHQTGSLPDADKAAVLDAYYEVTGLRFTGTCKACQWSDVQHALSYYLSKTLKLPAMSTSTKYLIAPTLAFLAVHGLAYVYINKGSGAESDSAKFLTDAVAEGLLKKHPDLEGEAIIRNPDYDPKATKAAAAKKDKEQELTPAQKAAATKAANKAEAEADAQAAAEAKTDTDPEADVPILQ